MMLRASIETEGGKVDLRSLTDGSFADRSGIEGAAALVGWVEATTDRMSDVSRIARARDRVRDELGSAAMVDAAAIIGNFERMVRIADATGIPLDTPVNIATESIRADLGIDRFHSAAHSPPVRRWQRAIGRALDPIRTFGLRRLGGRRGD